MLIFCEQFQASEFIVNNVQMRGGYVVLVGDVEGKLSVGDTVLEVIDEVIFSFSVINFAAYLRHLLNFFLNFTKITLWTGHICPSLCADACPFQLLQKSGLSRILSFIKILNLIPSQNICVASCSTVNVTS